MFVQRNVSGKQEFALTPRDLAVLTLVHQQRAMSLDHLPRFIAALDRLPSDGHRTPLKGTTHHMVERFQRAGLIHLQRFGNSPLEWIWLTHKGLRTLGISSSPKDPPSRMLPVFHAANTIRLALAESDPHLRWISRQQLRTVDPATPFHFLPTGELLTEGDERIAIHVILRLTSTEMQIANRMRFQLERETAIGTPYYRELWYYAPSGPVERLRAARSLVAQTLTKEIARDISIFSYPLIPNRVLYREHDAPVVALAWSPDGTRLASVAEEIHVWDAPSGEERYRLFPPPLPTALGWSCRGSWIGLGDEEGGLSFWDGSGDAGPLLTIDHPGKVTGLAWSPREDNLVASCSASGTLLLFDVGRKTRCWKSAYLSGAETLTWSPDSERLAVGGDDGTVHLFDAATGNHLHTYQKHVARVSAVVWSSNSQHLASAAGDHTILIWDANTGKKRRTIWSSLSTIEVLAWSPDGTWLACAGSESAVEVWNVQTGQLLLTYRDHGDTITSLAWSPDSSLLASGSTDRTVHVSPVVQTPSF